MRMEKTSNASGQIVALIIATSISFSLSIEECRAETGINLKLNQVEGALITAALRLGYPLHPVMQQPCLPQHIACHYEIGSDVTISFEMNPQPDVYMIYANFTSWHAAFEGTKTFSKFRQACEVIVAAVRKDWPVAKIKKIASDMTIQLSGSKGKRFKEDGLEFSGEKHSPSISTNPGEAYYVCRVIAGD